jgi:hypothetical protein
MQWTAVVCLAWALLAGAETAKAAVPAPPDLGARARQILADPQYQRSLPKGSDGDGGKGDSHGKRTNPLIPRPGSDAIPQDSGGTPVRFPALPAELGAVAEMLLYLLLAAGIVLAVFALVQRLRSRSASAGLEPPEAPREEAVPRRPERPAPELDDAGRLAAEGRWDEALHMLLLQAIRILSGRLPAPLPPSSTSRELLRLVPLSAEARQAFAGMVRAVELSLFGGAPVGPEEYRENRERFRIVSGRAV